MENIITYVNSKFSNLIAQVNMPKGITCNLDAPCNQPGSSCYCNKGKLNIQNVKQAHLNRFNLYKDNPVAFFERIDVELKFRPSVYFRWHTSGDIPDMQYLDLMCKLARKHKGTNFLCFTKQFAIVNKYLETHRKPKNLILCLSNWGDWCPPNPHNLPTAWVEFRTETDDLIPVNANECGGNCAECINTSEHCWRMQKGDSVKFKCH